MNRAMRLETFSQSPQETRAGVVSLGDRSTCDVRRIEMVKIKKFDKVLCTFGGVVYVPKMRRNLVSLGQLDCRGYMFLATGRAMKITRGFMVLMKEEKCGGLYRLVGDTVTGVPKISMASWKQGNGVRTRRVFFAVGAETGFQVADDGEKVTQNLCWGGWVKIPL
ncbi:uncharacterized protein LOC143863221 [Tasmannia lanceolata]|uniref:uncharacterized protein LOC143863221 n=1 Tax=Tasmannia lanceolata TaxID=3420 RepID=UPI0040647640